MFQSLTAFEKVCPFGFICLCFEYFIIPIATLVFSYYSPTEQLRSQIEVLEDDKQALVNQQQDQELSYENTILALREQLLEIQRTGKNWNGIKSKNLNCIYCIV